MRGDTWGPQLSPSCTSHHPMGTGHSLSPLCPSPPFLPTAGAALSLSTTPSLGVKLPSQSQAEDSRAGCGDSHCIPAPALGSLPALGLTQPMLLPSSPSPMQCFILISCCCRYLVKEGYEERCGRNCPHVSDSTPRPLCREKSGGWAGSTAPSPGWCSWCSVGSEGLGMESQSSHTLGLRHSGTFFVLLIPLLLLGVNWAPCLRKDGVMCCKFSGMSVSFEAELL